MVECADFSGGSPRLINEVRKVSEMVGCIVSSLLWV